MRRDRLVKLLSNNVVNVTFTKKIDGSTRRMRCTLDRTRVPVSQRAKLRSRAKIVPGLVTAYDIQRRGFRSFYIRNIQKVEKVLAA